ncbi:hypothetical protein [Aquimonas sp.]|uniref:hypothetical protein n=1 Tax=Aquimonas sp. TaxID=1872588 RepID=UPI0037C13D66
MLNNPLSLTDPSGYLSLGQILRTVVAVAITVYTGGAAGALWSQALYGQAFAVAVAGGFAAGAVQSGTLKGGLQGAFSAAIFFGIGSYFDQANSASSWARKGDKLSTIGPGPLARAAALPRQQPERDRAKQGVVSAANVGL